MNRGLALRVVLGLVGLIFVASAYPLVTFVRAAPALSMMFSLYVPSAFSCCWRSATLRRAAT